MKKLVIYSLAALVLAALALSSILASYQRRLLRQEATLQKRLRDLSDQNDKLEAELHRLALLAGRDVLQRRIEKEVQEIRGLKFLRPLQYKRLSREELPAYLKRDMLASYTPEEFQDYLESLAAMGFLPEGGDLEKTLIDLLGEQIAAFYDPREAALYTFETFDIDRTTDQTIYAHELTHALQDQHFGLLRNTPLEIKDNDDRAAAAKALVEGDACLLMTFFFQRHFDPLKFVSKDLGPMLSQPMEKLNQAPAYLRETLLFSYQEGEQFCLNLYQEGGFRRVDQAFKELPASTEQILHPEKYLEKNDPPIEISLDQLPPLSGKRIGNNVAGELGIQLLLSDQLQNERARLASEGWGGDRYLVYRTAPGKHAIVWVTQWDTEVDARQFLQAYTEYYVKKHHLVPVEDADKSAAVMFSFAGRQQTFTRRDKSVVILDVENADEAEKLLQSLWQKPPEKPALSGPSSPPALTNAAPAGPTLAPTNAPLPAATNAVPRPPQTNAAPAPAPTPAPKPKSP